MSVEGEWSVEYHRVINGKYAFSNPVFYFRSGDEAKVKFDELSKASLGEGEFVTLGAFARSRLTLSSDKGIVERKYEEFYIVESDEDKLNQEVFDNLGDFL